MLGAFIEHLSVKRIAYVTSFGASNWEFTDDQTSRYAQLLNHFPQ